MRPSAYASVIGIATASLLALLAILGWGRSMPFGPYRQTLAADALLLCILSALLLLPAIRRRLDAAAAVPLLTRLALIAMVALSLPPPLVALATPNFPLDPDRMLLFMTLPLGAALLSVLLLTLPRILTINLLVLLGLAGLSELAFRFLPLSAAPSSTGDLVIHTGSYLKGYFKFDPLLGYRGSPKSVSTSRRQQGEQVIYDVHYSIGPEGFRLSTPSWATAGRFIAFFGDSFMIGEGVNDSETLPSQTALRSRDINTYNYGFHGYGPQQMLALLENPGELTAIKERSGVAVFGFIDSHLARLKGSLQILKWGHHMPYYRMNGGGEISRHGNFTDGRPLLAVLYPVLERSRLFRFFSFDPLSKEFPEDYDFAAGLFAKSCRIFSQRFESAGCYVLIYPGSKRAAHELAPRLSALGVGVLDYSRLYDDTDRAPYVIASDGHPSANGHALVADQLVNDLKLPRLPPGDTSQ